MPLHMPTMSLLIPSVDIMDSAEVVLRFALLHKGIYKTSVLHLSFALCTRDRLCGLVVRVSGYRYRGPGFDPRRYQIF